MAKRKISEEGRARIAAAQKARWENKQQQILENGEQSRELLAFSDELYEEAMRLLQLSRKIRSRVK